VIHPNFISWIVLYGSNVKISQANSGGGALRRNVLLVDDDHDIIEVLKRGLQTHGMYVDSYTSPQEALASFRPNTYDIAILDIRMPAMTGFQLFRELKKFDTGLPVCFLSAFEIQPEEFKSMFPSMDGVKSIIKKPVSINKLLKEINPFLSVSPRVQDEI
jgi:DNA-binding response OmpR family regulator